MTDMLLMAYRNGFGYGGGGFGIAHIVVSAIIRGVIFGVIFRLMRQLTLTEGILLAVVVVVLVYAWSRSRGPRY